MKLKFENKIVEVCKESTEIEGCFTQGTRIEDSETTQKIYELTKDFKKDDVFLDIGANVGTMSLVATGKVYAFEPTKSTFKLLKKNIDLNPILDITPVCEAVGDREERYVVRENEEGYSGMNIICSNINGERQMITIDFWTDNNSVGNIKLIKIDTEGWDNRVILGAIKIIKRYKPLIITESIIPELLESWYNQEKIGINTLWTPKK